MTTIKESARARRDKGQALAARKAGVGLTMTNDQDKACQQSPGWRWWWWSAVLLVLMVCAVVVIAAEWLLKKFHRLHGPANPPPNEPEKSASQGATE